MAHIHETDLILTAVNCDMNGRWKPSAVLDAMQDAAGCHGELLGFGRKALAELGIVWVITRMEVKLDRIPAIGETVHLKTWPAGVRRWFCPRYFTFTDGDGQPIGAASTLWAVMDWQSRRMVSPAPIQHLFPDNSALTPPLGLPAPAPAVEAEPIPGTYLPRYSDMDVNGHVNNIRYMDMCCNALGMAAMKEHPPVHFMISYDREILPEQEVVTRLQLQGDAFSFTGTVGDQRCFEIGGRLKD